MRFLIVAAAVLACASASGLLAAPYGYGVHPALPTISHGDLAGAAIDAHVEQSDHVRAAVDANRGLYDQAAELQGRAINAAESHSWQAVDAAQTAHAQLDGHAAGVAPILAKQIAGQHAYAAHAAYAAPAALGHAAYAAPAVVGHSAYATPAALGYSAYAAPAVVGHAAYAAPAALGYSAYAAPAVVGHAAYAAPAYAASKTVVSQSLSQSHPSALVHSAPLIHSAPAYAGYGHGW